jgi:hypothetical protein
MTEMNVRFGRRYRRARKRGTGKRTGLGEEAAELSEDRRDCGEGSFGGLVLESNESLVAG